MHRVPPKDEVLFTAATWHARKDNLLLSFCPLCHCLKAGHLLQNTCSKTSANAKCNVAETIKQVKSQEVNKRISAKLHPPTNLHNRTFNPDPTYWESLSNDIATMKSFLHLIDVEKPIQCLNFTGRVFSRANKSREKTEPPAVNQLW